MIPHKPLVPRLEECCGSGREGKRKGNEENFGHDLCCQGLLLSDGDSGDGEGEEALNHSWNFDLGIRLAQC